MHVHPGRATLVAIALAEVGALAGALVCWLFFTGWALASYGSGVLSRNNLLGIALWALFVGVPVGALVMPLIGLGVLRRAPLWRTLLIPAVGAVIGLAIWAKLRGGPAILPVPLLAGALAAGGVVAASVVAQVEWGRARGQVRRRLPSWRRPTLR